MNEFFFNSVGRLRSGWRAAIFASLNVLFTAIFSVILFLIIRAATSDNDMSFLSTSSGMVVTSLYSLILAVLVSWFCGKFLEDLPFTAVGWSFHKSWFTQTIFGLIVGVISLIIACVLAMPTGNLSFQPNDTADLVSILQTIFGSAIVFAVAAASEEIIFRGYVLQTFSRAKLAWVGVLLTSLPFAIAHLGNPNVDYISTLNTALAGIWLGIAYLKTRSLWFAFGVHFAWNWVQGAFLGLPVSGLKQLTTSPILQSIDQGPMWLTGGSYGIEGGITCTIALIISTIIIWFMPNLKADKEMSALTSKENPRKLTENER
jgi:uncharacterized protein